jgi:hypothetical protein
MPNIRQAAVNQDGNVSVYCTIPAGVRVALEDRAWTDRTTMRQIIGAALKAYLGVAASQ